MYLGDREHAACELARSTARRDAAAQTSISGRTQLYRTITSPSDIAQQFGIQTGANASMMQADTQASRLAGLAGSQAAVDAIMAQPEQNDPTPRVYSLNGQPGQVNGCAWALPPQPPALPSPIPTMPLPAPVVVQTPLGPAAIAQGTAPVYSNLCEALYHGLVMQDQFDLNEYGQLYRKCAELGWAGGYAPPADVHVWQMNQQKAGTLPHIPVGQAELDQLPRKGLTGYSAPWSDALVEDIQSPASGPDMGVGQWIQDHPWLSLAIAVGGAVALSRRAK